ncbi:hypothetical protein A1O1_07168 [Capronia coronata CBS 617.96]|uniref:L-ornithine N(5)-monooxygenase n=1 Tax=Capronia coronata CBS 617.96 TaxID=1182541 RepID=W9Y1N5_9EURO|nr:uncharacterized protein A1O1_07168 [Capronia coronata CBS 617.96]EXJ83545.1 hypothetical protein A1O1_07168 [Capronia coronata CBS 617.96]
MAHGEPQQIDTVIVGNGPSALILSYILHGNIPCYDESSPHPDHILHDKLVRWCQQQHHDHDDALADNLLNLDIDALTEHFTASRFSYSTQALPVNVLLDTLVRPLGETDDAQKKTCVKWRHDSSQAVSHLVVGNTPRAGGQWVDNPVHASWDIGTLSYAGMISLPEYGFDEHYERRHGRPMPVYLRPSRRAVADYLAAYPEQVGINDSISNGQQVSGVSRHGGGFYIASHNILCRNLVLASGIFSHMIPPPPLLQALASLPDNNAEMETDALLVIGSGFSAADVIISSAPTRKILHVYKWAPSTSPSPLRACHQQAYPEYAGVYRRMKLAAISSSHQQPKDKRSHRRPRPRQRHAQSDFDLSRDWDSTYEGLPNAEIADVEMPDDGTALVTFTMRTGFADPTGSADPNASAPSFQRRVSGLAYVVGRRGSLEYLSPELLKEVLPRDTSSRDKRAMVSGHTLREKANADLEVAPHVFIIGSVTGDSLIRFAYGGCTYAAGKIMTRRSSAGGANGNRNGSGGGSNAANGESLLASTDKDKDKGMNSIHVSLRESAGRCQTPSPKIPAMNGLDGHAPSPASLAEKGMSLDRRKES